MSKYKVYLENLIITQFIKLIEVVRKTCLSVKAVASIWEMEEEHFGELK